MTIDDQILINKFGQSLLRIQDIVTHFHSLDIDGQRNLLKDIVYLLIQTRPKEADLDLAIEIGKLRPTFTPVVKLKKGGLVPHVFRELLNLPENEWEKVLILLLSIYKISYGRILEIEKNNPDKWWFQDLSDESFITRIRSLSNVKIVVRKLFNKEGVEAAAVITAWIPFSLNLYEKNIIERQLELYAFNRLYPGKGLTLYKEIYDDVASITVMHDLDSIPYELNEISVSVY